MNVSDSPQSHENKRKPNEDRATQDITKTTVLIVKTQNVDEDKKKKTPAKEVHLHKIDSLSDHERSSDEETKPTKKTHLHSPVVVTHVNNGVTHGKSSADEKRRLDEIEEQLKITRIENERLRTQLSSLDKKFAVRETEDLRSKKDHDEQLKHWMTSANKQLEETNKHKQNYEKTKEELGRVKGELERHDRAKSEHERSLKEATAKVAELAKQLGEKEKLIVSMREKHETGGGGGDSKADRELEVERNLRLKLTEELAEANRKIHSLTSQVEAHEKTVDAHKRSVQELGNETRLRKKQEKLLDEAKEMVNTLGKQIEEKDKQLKAEKERHRRSNSQEQEQAKKAQDDAKSKLISVTQKLEETAKELEHSKTELSKEKAQKRNQETVLLEANRKISELSRLLNEKDSELAAVKLEHEKTIRRRSSNPFETQSKSPERSAFSTSRRQRLR